jgi:hypothetical protein
VHSKREKGEEKERWKAGMTRGTREALWRDAVMKLMTKQMEKAAREQHAKYAVTSLSELQIVAKFFDPCGSWTWYLIT